MSEAFILGNGPSLTVEILDRLDELGAVTFAVNRIALLFDRTEWRPTYYIGVTTAVSDPRHRGDILRGIREAGQAYCWEKYPIDELPDDVVLLKCSELWDEDVEKMKDSIWSDDITKRVSKFGVSAFPAMQVAVHLGYDRLYLIGCDGNYQPPKDGVDLSHFDAGYRPFIVCHNYDYGELNDALQKAHWIAQRNADRLGVEIYNLSPISVIEAHPRMEMEKVLCSLATPTL